MSTDDLNRWIGCDQCGSAQAMYLIKLVEGELAFCGHHYNEFKDALDKWSYEIVELAHIINSEKAEVNGSTD